MTVSVTYNPGPTPPPPSPFHVREASAPPLAAEHALSLFTVSNPTMILQHTPISPLQGIDDPDPDHTGAGYDWGDDLTLEELQHCQDVEDIAYYESSTPSRRSILPLTPPRRPGRRHY